jgi:U3 small nucleolar RNA-associated protein 20
VGLVVELALSEMFGTVAEEKEVMKITAKLAEAKGTKSYDSLQILSKYDSVITIYAPMIIQPPA